MNLNIMLKRHQVMYNLHIASRLGVYSAIFVQYLIDARDVFKDKLGEGGCFPLSNQQICLDTAMDIRDLERVREHLIAYELISIKPFKANVDKMYYILNESKLTEIIDSPKEKLLDIVTKPGEVKTLIPSLSSKPISQKQLDINNEITQLKLSIIEPDIRVREVIFEWIDSIYESKKSITKTGLKSNLGNLNEFADGNKKIKIEILRTASTYAHKTLNYVIEGYKNKDHSMKEANNFTQEELEENARLIRAGGGQKF